MNRRDVYQIALTTMQYVNAVMCWLILVGILALAMYP
jgi:hypothetical protein